VTSLEAEENTQPEEIGYDPLHFIPESLLDDARAGRMEGLQEHFRPHLIQAYKKWIGEMEPQQGSRVERIMMSCPLPGHPDKNPSAWYNSDKGTWFCGACQIGGVVTDLAAIGQGLPFPDYKKSPELFIIAAEGGLRDLGTDPDSLRTGETESQRVPAAPEAPAPAPAPTAPAAAVAIPKQGGEVGSDGEVDDPPKFDWREILQGMEDTFLWEWMERTEEHSGGGQHSDP
jgi:hypothetical protein